jgi:cyclohexyl-isocyanide hydratase
MDQIDFYRPLRSALANLEVNHSCDSENEVPVRDIQWLILTPEMYIAEAPEFDILLAPGGFGQQELMNDEEVFPLIRTSPRR